MKSIQARCEEPALPEMVGAASKCSVASCYPQVKHTIYWLFSEQFKIAALKQCLFNYYFNSNELIL